VVAASLGYVGMETLPRLVNTYDFQWMRSLQVQLSGVRDLRKGFARF
jgi:hypothetical protein